MNQRQTGNENRPYRTGGHSSPYCASHREMESQQTANLLSLYLVYRNRRRRRRHYVRPLNISRELRGEYHSLVADIWLTEDNDIHYFRMTLRHFLIWFVDWKDAYSIRRIIPIRSVLQSELRLLWGSSHPGHLNKAWQIAIGSERPRSIKYSTKLARKSGIHSKKNSWNSPQKSVGKKLLPTTNYCGISLIVSGPLMASTLPFVLLGTAEVTTSTTSTPTQMFCWQWLMPVMHFPWFLWDRTAENRTEAFSVALSSARGWAMIPSAYPIQQFFTVAKFTRLLSSLEMKPSPWRIIFYGLTRVSYVRKMYLYIDSKKSL